MEHVWYSLIALPRYFMPVISARARPSPIEALAAKFNKHAVPISN